MLHHEQMPLLKLTTSLQSSRVSTQPTAPHSVLLELRRTRFVSLFCVAVPRVAEGEAWWARQDSNLQPDRYERPALTIELQAPPRLPDGEATVRLTPYNVAAVPAMAGFDASGTSFGFSEINLTAG
jgi:hypothetical protein